MDHLAAAPLAVSITHAVKLTGVSRSELYRVLAKGEVRARKAGRRTLIEYVSLREWLDRLPAAAFRQD